MRLYRAPDGITADVLEQLSDRPEVEHAGAVVSLRETGFSHLTRDVVVKVSRSGTDAAREIADQLGYELTRELPYAPAPLSSALRAPPAWSYSTASRRSQRATTSNGPSQAWSLRPSSTRSRRPIRCGRACGTAS